MPSVLVNEGKTLWPISEMEQVFETDEKQTIYQGIQNQNGLEMPLGK